MRDELSTARQRLGRALPWALAAALLLALVVPDAGMPTAVAGAVDNALHGSKGHRYRVVAVAIRNSGHGWRQIRDASHDPTGVQQVVTADDRIELRYSFQATKIVSFVVTPDEALARADVIAGASVGLTSAKISIARDGKPLDPRHLTIAKYPLSDLWVYGVFEIAP